MQRAAWNFGRRVDSNYWLNSRIECKNNILANAQTSRIVTFSGVWILENFRSQNDQHQAQVARLQSSPSPKRKSANIVGAFLV